MFGPCALCGQYHDSSSPCPMKNCPANVQSRGGACKKIIHWWEGDNIYKIGPLLGKPVISLPERCARRNQEELEKILRWGRYGTKS